MNVVKIDRKISIKLVFLILIIATIIIIGFETAPWLIEHGRDPKFIRDYLAGYGNAGFLVYILIQVIHVIIVIIPGDLILICAGYVYGIPLGFVLSYFGLMLGSVIVFYISRYFGYEIVSKFISKEKIEKLSEILNSTKGKVGLLIVCCIPFIPKDLLMYIAGITPVKASRLFLVYGLSRIPATLIWVSVGANAFEKDWLELGITIAFTLVLLVILFFVGKNYHKKAILKK
jgi:uncharacterized membrane protein YdjX (TVP38/TMEM64 family)